MKRLAARGVDALVRPVVEPPHTPADLARWNPASGLGVRTWLNTSGLRYRARSKAKLNAARDAQLSAVLSAGGKRATRPDLVHGPSALVGFKDEVQERYLGS